MEWPLILGLVIAIPIILIPVVFIWYLNVGGVYAAIKEGRLKVFQRIVRVVRIGLAIIVPIAVYAFLIWFFLGNLGWQVALATALALPVVFFVAVLVWVAVASGLYQVIRDTLRRRVTVPKRRAVRMAEERASREAA
jgi:uncharacterized membrane protein (UPF0182 family)